ncbi:MAG: mechanosensitive ion channel family protein [Bacteroidaceae bacterium]|nr:mechanosensitive ion channel family protein [Bacteroidaceae bacterium]
MMKTCKWTTLWVLLFLCLHAHAVLNEKNLEQTLSVLRVELATTNNELKQNMAMLSATHNAQHQKMISTMQKSNQTALMLYSQKSSYTFNLTYACHEAAEQYREFTKNQVPYDQIVRRINLEINRYTQLIETLQKLPPSLIKRPDTLARDSQQARPAPPPASVHPFMLSEKAQEDRTECVKFAMNILKQYQQIREDLNRDSEHYEHTQQRLQKVYEYAQRRYRDIQQNIFINGENNYLTTLKRLPYTLMQVRRDLNDKYGDKNFVYNHVKSDWRGSIVLGLTIFVVFYFALSFLLSNLIVRILMRRWKRLQNEDMRLKMDCIITAASLCIFAIAIMFLRSYMHHNFFIMASQQLMSFAWLCTIILISLLVRLDGKQIRKALRLFMPIMILGFIVIIFRIIFIPNSLVSLIFPPLLIVFTLWQWLALRNNGRQVPASDRIYSIISLSLMVVATFMAWSGYVLMSVQVFIWWLILLMMILTITSLYDILQAREEIYLKRTLKLKDVPQQNWLRRKGDHIDKTWLYDMLSMMVLPVAIVLSFLGSIYMAAQVFDLTEICLRIFQTPFVDIENVCRLSLAKIVLVASLYFVFNYVCYIVKSFYRMLRLRHISKKNKGVSVAANQANFTLFYNITAIVVWGSYFILALIILQVPKSGISIVTAGLATGIGFAMKDLLNNFFYGISLMTGRLRVGDWIECDGIRGKVDSITYQSTQIVTADGCVIAFLNSTLFSKNFKNLTRNHSYVMSKIVVGVAYGTDVGQVRKALVDSITKMMHKNKSGRDVMNPKKGVSVLLSDFGESSVDLAVIYWTLVEEKAVFDLKVKETIYETLNAHHIEIPFPQRDLHLRSGWGGSATVVQ